MGLFDATQTSRTTTERLDKIVIEVGLDDLIQTLRYVGATAIQEQRTLGNPPTNILVDGRGNAPIDGATKRIQAFFADKEQIRLAVYDAWKQIQGLTRVATGLASLSYELWYNEQPVGRTPAAVETYLDRFNPQKDYFRIVGPVLVYGRKIYWRPKGAPGKRPRVSKRVALRTGSAVFKVVRNRGIMNLVEESMRRRYRSIAIAEDWVNTNALPKDGRTPALWIGFKRKGAVVNG